jgi:transcriptional regulator with XRE-family HTH domain
MKKISELRRELDLSRSQLARASGVSVRTLEAYEQGLKDIKKAGYLTVRELAHALGVTVETIAGRSATELRAELERLGYAPSFIAQMSDAEVYRTEEISEGVDKIVVSLDLKKGNAEKLRRLAALEDKPMSSIIDEMIEKSEM